MAIRTGNVSGTGIAIGSAPAKHDTRGFSAAKVAGLDVKFQPGAEVANRQVVIAGVSITLGEGASLDTTLKGVPVRAEGNRLWVKGEEVDFGGKPQQRAAKAAVKDVVDSRPAPTPPASEVRQTQDSARALAQAQAQGASTVFGVQEPVAERGDVRALLTGSKVSGADLERLFAAGVSPSELDRELVKNG